MAKAAVFSTISSARTFCGKVNARLGLPSPGQNALDGSISRPGSPGWTIAYYVPIRVTDTTGSIGAAGSVYFLVGPISGRMAAKIATLNSPPTIIDVPTSLFMKGRKYRQYIQSWSGEVPVVAESQEDFDETVPP